MKRFILATLTAVIMVALVCVSATIPAPKDRDVSGDAPRITMEELKSMLGDPNLVIIDSLVGDQWETVAQKLPGTGGFSGSGAVGDNGFVFRVLISPGVDIVRVFMHRAG